MCMGISLNRFLLLALMLVFPGFVLAQTYVSGKVTEVATHYSGQTTGFSVKISDSNYAGCNNKYILFKNEDFAASSADPDEGLRRMEYARSMALAAFTTGFKIQFMLKSEGGTCSGQGWLKILKE